MKSRHPERSKGSSVALQPNPRINLRALPWLFCFQFFVAEQIARLHVDGPYSMAQNAISDLGAIHRFGVAAAAATSFSPWHAMMNASFALQGLLILSGELLVRRFFPPGAFASLAFAAFAWSGISLFLVGVAPEDTAGQLHVLAATVHFLTGSLALLLLGVALLKSSIKLSGSLTAAAGALALAATMMLGWRHSAAWAALGWGVGAVERVAAYPLPGGFRWRELCCSYASSFVRGTQRSLQLL
jgi:hypothetical membrane protein